MQVDGSLEGIFVQAGRFENGADFSAQPAGLIGRTVGRAADLHARGAHQTLLVRRQQVAHQQRVQIGQVIQVQHRRRLGPHHPSKALTQVQQHHGIGVALSSCGHPQTQQVVGVDPIIGVAFDARRGIDEIDRHFLIVAHILPQALQRVLACQLMKPSTLRVGKDGAQAHESGVVLHGLQAQVAESPDDTASPSPRGITAATADRPPAGGRGWAVGLTGIEA